MNSILENKEKSKRTSVKFSFQSILMLMAAIMMAFATLTSCDEDDKNDDDNGGSGSNNTFKLKIWEGFDIPNKRVIDYGDNSKLVDLTFFYQFRPSGPAPGTYIYLGADKIKEFDAEPTGLTVAQVDEWLDWICPPIGGKYYVIRARNERHYLFHVLKYENQGMAPTEWLLTFAWKEITVK